VLRCPEQRDHRVKERTHCSLNLRPIFFNNIFDDGCCQDKECSRVNDPPVNLREVPRVPIRIESPDEENADIDLDVVFYRGKIHWLSFYQTHKDNNVDRMDEKHRPQVG